MAERARAILAKATAEDRGPKLKGIRGSYRFDIEGGGSWHVVVDQETLRITESTADADCVVRCDEETFVRIANGEQNLLTAALQGRVQIRGDMALAQKLHGFVRTAREAA
jgi:putative sterol carrier protein